MVASPLARGRCRGAGAAARTARLSPAFARSRLVCVALQFAANAASAAVAAQGGPQAGGGARPGAPAGAPHAQEPPEVVLLGRKHALEEHMPVLAGGGMDTHLHALSHVKIRRAAEVAKVEPARARGEAADARLTRIACWPLTPKQVPRLPRGAAAVVLLRAHAATAAQGRRRAPPGQLLQVPALGASDRA